MKAIFVASAVAIVATLAGFPILVCSGVHDASAATAVGGPATRLMPSVGGGGGGRDAMWLGSPDGHNRDEIDSRGHLLYANQLGSPASVRSWTMEGPGKLEFDDGWMQMYSPGMEADQVLWCPEIFPGSFVAEWEVRNLRPESGLLIVTFAASGVDGEDLFDPSLQPRDGTFSQYIQGDIRSYHISYYANSLNKPDRGTLHLRKNPGLHLAAKSNSPIAADSVDIHRLRLEKSGPEIEFFIDGRRVLTWVDDGTSWGPPLGAGRIGFRQMRSSRFQYRNFRVYAPAGQ